MSAIFLRFPGFLLAEDGKGFWKDGSYHAGVDALMGSVPEHERCRTLDWNRKRYPKIIARAFERWRQRRMTPALFHSTIIVARIAQNSEETA